MNMETNVQHTVYVSGKEWRLANPNDREDRIQQVVVKLEIIGDEDNGFHLCVTAVGCNTYDTWCETVDEAIADALEAYAAPVDGWSMIRGS